MSHFQSSLRLAVLIPSIALLAACDGQADYDPRGVDYDETLLSVSATGEADTTPDEARFEAGVNNWASTAESAAEQTREEIETIVAALRELGIEDKDIQTRTVNVQRIDWGDRRGQFQASNVVNVRVRDIDKAGPAVTAVTSVGANIVSGPELRISDAEGAANTAYSNAYAAALARAEAYAGAAGMEVSRVLTIRDAGGSQGNRYIPGAPPPPVSPVVMNVQSSAAESFSNTTILPGQTTSIVSVQVDFALRAK